MSSGPSVFALLFVLGAAQSSTAAVDAGPERAGEAGRAALRWQAPPECGRGDEVEARISYLLGRSFASTGIQAEVVVQLRGVEDWSLVLTSRRGAELDERVLEAKSCATLVNALALVLSVLADPVAVSFSLGVEGHMTRVAPVDADPDPDSGMATVVDIEVREDAPGSAVIMGEEPRVDREPAIGDELALGDEVGEIEDDFDEPQPIRGEGAGWSRKPASVRSVPLEWILRIGGGAEFGALPATSGSIMGALGVRRRRLQIELSGLYIFPQSGDIEGLEGASVRAKFGTAGLRGCGLPVVGDISVSLCAGIEAGGMEGESLGVDSARRERALWLAGLAGSSLHWSLSPFAGLWLGGELAIPILSPVFQIESNSDEVEDIDAHVPAVVSGRILAGVEIQLALRGAKK